MTQQVQPQLTAVQDDSSRNLRTSNADDSEFQREQDKIQSLTKENISLQSRLEKLQKDLQEREDGIVQKQQAFDSAGNQLTDYQERIRDLDAAKSIAEQKLQEATAKMALTHGQALSNAQRELEAAKTELGAREQDLRDLKTKTNTEIAEAQKQLDVARSEMKEQESLFSEAKAKLVAEVSAMQHKLDETIALATQQQADAAQQLIAGKDNLESTTNKFQAVIGKKQTTINELNAALAQKDETIRQLKERVDEYKPSADRLGILEGENKRLVEELAASKAMHANAKADLAKYAQLAQEKEALLLKKIQMLESKK